MIQDCKKCYYKKIHTGIGFCHMAADKHPCCKHYFPTTLIPVFPRQRPQGSQKEEAKEN